jgi:hypothetical protein
MYLNDRARQLMEAFCAGMARDYGVANTERYFAMTDPKETALRLALLESVEMLNMITCLDVDQLSGQVISVGASGLYTGRKEDGRFIRRVGWTVTPISLLKPTPARPCAGICFPSGLTPARPKKSFSSWCKPSLTRPLHWTCCVSVLTVRVLKKHKLRDQP